MFVLLTIVTRNVRCPSFTSYVHPDDVRSVGAVTPEYRNVDKDCPDDAKSFIAFRAGTDNQMIYVKEIPDQIQVRVERAMVRRARSSR